MYAKKHVEALSKDTMKVYIINVDQWSTEKKQNKFIHTTITNLLF